MKIALCFSGLPRMLKETYPYWMNCIILKYKPDIFIHTWKQDFDVEHTLHSLYHPIILRVESSKAFDTSIYIDRIWPHRTTPNGVLNQWYSVKQSISFKDEYEALTTDTYDIVVRARFDWYLREINFEVNDYVNVANTPGLVEHKFNYNNQQHIGISDQFAYGSSHIMNIYAKLFGNIPFLYQTKEVDFCSELLLKAHLIENQIEVKEHLFQNGITRMTGIVP